MDGDSAQEEWDNAMGSAMTGTLGNTVSPKVSIVSAFAIALLFFPGSANGRVFAFQSSATAAATPQLSPAAGIYHSPVTVTITDSTPGATIHYSLHGAPLSVYSPVYTKPILIQSTTTVKAFAIATGYSNSAVATAKYSIDLLPAAEPEFTPPPATYMAPQVVRITDTTPGAIIYYTTRGKTPSTSSRVYKGPIRVDDSETIRAVAMAKNFLPSAMATASYEIIVNAAKPVIHPGSGSYSSPQSVRMTDPTPGAAIFFTTDGKAPTTSSTRYTGPIELPFSQYILVLRAIAGGPGFNSSAVASATYTITPLVATPVFFPPAATYSDGQSVTMSDSTKSTTIHYTTNGQTPTPTSPEYSSTSPIDVQDTETVNAIAVTGAGAVSEVGSATYTITQGVTAPASVSTRPALNGAVVVSLSTTSSGATIYYTLDGSTPTSGSPVYQAPFLVDSAVTLKTMAVASGYADSPVTTHRFTTQIPSGTLVWSDEFSNATGHDAQPDPLIWTYDTGNSGFGNQELENYCAWGSNTPPCSTADPNAYVGTDGYLHIVAREPSTGVYTSARLKTQGLFSFRYGRMEVRAKVPEGQGFWPAAWLLGNNIATVNWPACGEQDDLERVNAASSPDWNEGSIHGTGFTGANLGTVFHFPAGQTAAEWHTYGMIWSPGQVAYYIDDPTKPYATYTASSLKGLSGAVWPFDAGQSNFILLNLAVGGDWPGAPNSTTIFPSEYEVDYVRIFAN
jgi:beta-glucanase (GH16 family)